MADVLIRDIPEDVLAEVDAHAARLGLSRAEYIRRRLTADAAVSSSGSRAMTCAPSQATSPTWPTQR